MARMNVNPTRMELSGLKKALATAQKGHKLLKDKRDELMRQFLITAREASELRREAEEKIIMSQKYLNTAAAVMGERDLKTALLPVGGERAVKVRSRNVMSVLLPEFDIPEEDFEMTYSYAGTSSELDKAVEVLAEVYPKLIRLAGLEKSAQLMAEEIERTRRRVNALEYVMIPRYEETIKYITMRLDENERANSIRLLKVNDLIIAENINKKHNDI